MFNKFPPYPVYDSWLLRCMCARVRDIRSYCRLNLGAYLQVDSLSNIVPRSSEWVSFCLNAYRSKCSMIIKHSERASYTEYSIQNDCAYEKRAIKKSKQNAMPSLKVHTTHSHMRINKKITYKFLIEYQRMHSICTFMIRGSNGNNSDTWR